MGSKFFCLMCPLDGGEAGDLRTLQRLGALPGYGMTHTREYNVVIERDPQGRYTATLDEQPGWYAEAGTLEEITRQVESKLSQPEEPTEPQASKA